MLRVSLLTSLNWLASWLIWWSPLAAQEFRIESQIYMGESTLPVSQNVTLFSEKLVCDFLMSNEVDPHPIEIVVLDPHQHLLVLLDVRQQIRVEIPDLQVLRLLDELRRETKQNEQAKFLLEDSFEEDTDWSQGFVTLTSPSIVYRFKGEQPKQVMILPKYFEFLDSFTNLNATDPKKMPPFPRIRLNQSIKKLGWIPTEVQMSIIPNGFFREPMRAESKHTMTMGLTDKDRALIVAAKQYWTQFKAVTLTKYRGIEQPKIPIIARLNARNEKAAEDR